MRTTLHEAPLWRLVYVRVSEQGHCDFYSRIDSCSTGRTDRDSKQCLSASPYLWVVRQFPPTALYVPRPSLAFIVSSLAALIGRDSATRCGSCQQRQAAEP